MPGPGHIVDSAPLLLYVIERLNNKGTSMNNTTMVINLGADPEHIQLGDKEGRKLRCAEKAPGKKSVTRWFGAIVTGHDVEVADRLAKGDCLVVVGQLQLTEYVPKKPRFKGETIKTDEMPFCKILQVVKSPTFFGAKVDDDEPRLGATVTEAPDLGYDPLAGIA